MKDLRAGLLRDLVQGPFEAGRSRRERARGDVVLQKLAVDDVDDGGDEGLDVLCAVDEGLDVISIEKRSESASLKR